MPRSYAAPADVIGTPLTDLGYHRLPVLDDGAISLVIGAELECPLRASGLMQHHDQLILSIGLAQRDLNIGVI